MCLSETDLSEMKYAITFLQPFQPATQEMSGDTYVCLSKVIPLSKSLQQLTADVAGSSLCLGQNLLAEMNHRFRNIESNLLLAFPCILDPQFKKVAFSDAAALDACVRCLMDEMKTVAAVADDICIEIEEGTSTRGTENMLWKKFDQRVVDSAQARTTVGTLVEKQQYLQHANIDRHEDPLAWWRRKSFHLLQYLCIPSTSVPAERLFSKAGELVSARRSNIKPKNVNMLLFLNQNL